MLTLGPTYKHRGGYSSDATGATDLAECLISLYRRGDALAIRPLQVACTPRDAVFPSVSSHPDLTVIRTLVTRNSSEASCGSVKKMNGIKPPMSQNVSANKVTVALEAHADFGSIVCRYALCTSGGVMVILGVALQSSSRSSA